MKAEYRRLGDFIRQVDVRNKEQQVDLLLGLSIEKRFIPSIANTIGTDMSSYKIVEPMQFAYVPVTSRNGDKITIALYKGREKATISQAYTVFEVTKTDSLMQDYLMLWFLRPEFDRYARFKSHGSAREVFDWDEMCNVMLPVPPIEEQRRIVEQYQTVERRIKNNEKLIALLEDTAQTIFRHRFVEIIDPNNLPERWRMGNISDIASISSGKSLSDKLDSPNSEYQYPVAGASGIIGYAKEYNLDGPFLTTGRVGTIGVVNKYLSKTWAADNVLVFTSKYFEYTYQVLKSMNYEEITKGGVQSLITQGELMKYDLVIPPENEIDLFENVVSAISTYIKNLKDEIELNKSLLSLLLNKLS